MNNSTAIAEFFLFVCCRLLWEPLPKGGDASLSELFEDSDLPETLTAKTENGFHLFFQTGENIGI